MSRSFKKTPIVKDNSRGRKKDKRFANKKVRNTPFVSNGKQYRKHYNPWDIYDYVSYVSLQEWLAIFREDYETEVACITAWKKWYYNK